MTERIPVSPTNPAEGGRESLGQDLEGLIPGINMKGLQKESGGLYVPEQLQTIETSAIESAYSRQVARQFLDVRFDLPKWTEEDLRKTRELSQFLQGQIVVDVGAGETGLAYRIAQMGEARSYIAIEPYHFKRLFEELSNPERNMQMNETYPVLQRYPRLPFAVVGEDARSFLMRVPDSSVSLFTFGMDGLVLKEMPQQDLAELGKQYERVLNPTGVSMLDADSLIGRVGTQISKENTRNSSRPLYFLYSKAPQS